MDLLQILILPSSLSKLAVKKPLTQKTNKSTYRHLKRLARTVKAPIQMETYFSVLKA